MNDACLYHLSHYILGTSFSGHVDLSECTEFEIFLWLLEKQFFLVGLDFFALENYCNVIRNFRI